MKYNQEIRSDRKYSQTFRPVDLTGSKSRTKIEGTPKQEN